MKFEFEIREDGTLELWKDIVGYEGLYQVSSLGRVRSLNYRRSGRTKVMAPADNGRGYLQLILCKNGDKKHFRVNRLVAQAFIPNPENLDTVDHLNKDRKDNRVCNLRWLTLADNVRASVCRPIFCVETGVTYASIKEASDMLSIKSAGICKCCKGSLSSYKGFHFTYI